MIFLLSRSRGIIEEAFGDSFLRALRLVVGETGTRCMNLYCSCGLPAMPSLKAVNSGPRLFRVLPMSSLIGNLIGVDERHGLSSHGIAPFTPLTPALVYFIYQGGWLGS